jgi:hypothetical protein
MELMGIEFFKDNIGGFMTKLRPDREYFSDGWPGHLCEALFAGFSII